MHEPTNIKGVQQLTGRLAALSRFISRLGERYYGACAPPQTPQPSIHTSSWYTGRRQYCHMTSNLVHPGSRDMKKRKQKKHCKTTRTQQTKQETALARSEGTRTSCAPTK